MTEKGIEQGTSWLPGLSICIVTKDSIFYNRLALMQIRKLTRIANYEVLVFDNGSTDGSIEWLAEQPDVRLFRSKDSGALRHGVALDYLVSEATREITCTLCSDAFPVSREWITPSLQLTEKVILAGARKGDIVCPSFLFGWTSWLIRHSFADRWPKSDTGVDLSKQTIADGKEISFVEMKMVDLGRKFNVKPPNDYSGLVWHTWFTTRKKMGAGEMENGYHEYVQGLLRKRFSLDF